MGEINLLLPDELHRALKAEAARRGTTMRQLAVEAIEEALKKGRGKGGSRIE